MVTYKTWSRVSVLAVCVLLGISTASCFAQYTGPGAMSSSALDFGSISVNGKSAPQSITFSFAESETIAQIRVGASGTNGQDFRHVGGTCKVGASFSLNQQCTVQVAFLPDHVGEIRGAVSLFDVNDHVFATGFVHGIGSGSRLSFPSGASSLIQGLDHIYQLTADSVGNIYAAGPVSVSNAVTDQIYRIRPNGGVQLVSKPMPFSGPLAVDGASNIYLTVGPGAGMRKVGIDGTVKEFQATRSLYAIASDGEGNVYVGDEGAIDRLSSIGTLYPGSTLVGTRDQGEVAITGLVVPAYGQLIFDANAGPSGGGILLRGKIFQAPHGYATVAYDGGRGAAMGALAQNADGSLVAAVSGTINGAASSVSVLPFEASSVAIASNGDIYIANGTVTRLSRSSAPGLSFVAANRGEMVPATLSLTNTGNQPLLFDTDKVQITGANAASFHVEGTTCDAQTGLLPGASCTATVSFQSNQSGLATATLSTYTNDPAFGNNPVTVLLEGINP